LAGRFYQSIQPDKKGRLWSEQLGVFLGTWHGVVERRKGDWFRLFRPDGSLVPTPEERAEAYRQQAESYRADAECRRAEAESQRAEAERQRAETAETELARLRALLAERG
jgi:hypothetical protein